MKKALVVGGGSGIGLAMVRALLLRGYDHVYIAGKDAPCLSDIPTAEQGPFSQKTSFTPLNLNSEELSPLDGICDIDTLLITAGFGRVAGFGDLREVEIANLVKCNMLGAIRIIKKYYDQIHATADFFCAVMGSIAGHIASPLFSVYGAAKAGLCSFIENVNIELEAEGSPNRILDVSPGVIRGTNFSGTGNDLAAIRDLANEILDRALARERLYIPQYEETYCGVMDRYRADAETFGRESYEYKKPRLTDKPQVVVGYLSGTFDLFHIGHLNLLRRAKEQCDYLIVGVHRSGAWKGKETFIPFEERVEILKSIRYVDRVEESFLEDSDAYDAYHYDKLFVGSDYKGTPRFLQYEEYFRDKGVEIVYFPYTDGTSSTKLRAALSQKNDKK